MDILFPLFAGCMYVAGWTTAWIWNRHDVAKARVEVAEDLNARHALALKAADAGRTKAETENKILQNKLTATQERMANSLRLLPGNNGRKSAVGE